MPKLYEYFGLVVFFYTNEHQPVHVHGEFQNGFARAEIFLKEGKIIRIVFSNGKQDERFQDLGEGQG